MKSMSWIGSVYCFVIGFACGVLGATWVLDRADSRALQALRSETNAGFVVLDAKLDKLLEQTEVLGAAEECDSQSFEPGKTTL